MEATRPWADDGIVANAFMPGGIMTAFQRHVGRAATGIAGVAPYALDPAKAERLWEVSLELLA